MYLHTRTIVQKVCSMFSILNELRFQYEMQKIMKNKVFGLKLSTNTTTTKQKIEHKLLPELGIEGRTF